MDEDDKDPGEVIETTVAAADEAAAAEEAAEEAAFMEEYQVETAADSPNLVAPPSKPEDPKPADVEQEPAPDPLGEAAAEPPTGGEPAATEPDRFSEFEDRMSKRMRNVEGSFGGLKSELIQGLKNEIQAAVAARDETKATGGSAPTTAAITAAAGSSEKLEALKGEFPEWSDALDEQVGAMEVRLNERFDPEGIQKGVAESLSVQVGDALTNSTARLRQVLQVDMRHPGWEEDINTTDFQDWKSAQPDSVQALADSTLARDAISLLDKYKGAKKTAADKTAAKSRLAAAVAPTRGGTAAQAGPSEEDDFVSEYNA